jgi:SPP1 family predicted phage head-tail adaptor
MQAGNLRNRITVQDKNVTQNAYGEEVITWTTVDEVWAAVEPLMGREFMAAKQVQAEVSTRIRMRFIPGLAPEMRVLFGSRVFEILSVQHVYERRRELILMCKEIV